MKVYGYCPYEDLAAKQPLPGDPQESPPRSQSLVRKENPKTVAARRYRQRVLGEMLQDPDNERHGTLSGYKIGCRCDLCWQAYKVDHEERKKRAGR